MLTPDELRRISAETLRTTSAPPRHSGRAPGDMMSRRTMPPCSRTSRGRRRFRCSTSAAGRGGICATSPRSATRWWASTGARDSARWRAGTRVARCSSRTSWISRSSRPLRRDLRQRLLVPRPQPGATPRSGPARRQFQAGRRAVRSNPHGHNEEGWSAGRYSCFYDLATWRGHLDAVGFLELAHYYRPEGRPRREQPWLATVWRRL